MLFKSVVNSIGNSMTELAQNKKVYSEQNSQQSEQTQQSQKQDAIIIEDRDQVNYNQNINNGSPTYD